jgi:16S rRNA pseudouridine516 synthase
MEENELMRETQRLDKVLSNLGHGTRKEIRQLVKVGSVKVDGKTATDSGMHVDPIESIIDISGKVLEYRKYIYIMMNKPQDVISVSFDPKKRTVVDLLSESYKRMELFPAGRLDIDTEGLLILTNDGQTAHEILSPKKHVPKKYYALVEGAVDTKDAERFHEGVILDDGYKTMPSELKIIREGLRSEIELVLNEGKFHQVKRMFEAVGKKVIYLQRIEMGGLKLDESLKPGDYRELTSDEINLLKQSGA